MSSRLCRPFTRRPSSVVSRPRNFARSIPGQELPVALVAVRRHLRRLLRHHRGGRSFELGGRQHHGRHLQPRRDGLHLRVDGRELRGAGQVHRLLQRGDVGGHARLVGRELVDRLERVLLVDDGRLDVLAGALVGAGERLRRGELHLGQSAGQLVADPLRAVAGRLARDPDRHLIVCRGDGVGRRRADGRDALELRRVGLVHVVAGGVVPAVGPVDHHDARHLHAPVVEHLVVGRAVVRLDAVVERLVGARRRDDALEHRVGRAAVLDPLAVALADEAVVVLHHVVDVVRVAVRRPHHAHERLAPAEQQADHVEVDVAERLLHQRLVRLHPGAGARELGADDEADRALRAGQAALR